MNIPSFSHIGFIDMTKVLDNGTVKMHVRQHQDNSIDITVYYETEMIINVRIVNGDVFGHVEGFHEIIRPF